MSAEYASQPELATSVVARAGLQQAMPDENRIRR